MPKKHQRIPKRAKAPIVAAPSFFIKQCVLVLILFCAIAVTYRPSLNVPFLLDDYGKIIRNPDIKSIQNIPSRLIYPYKSPPEFNRNDPSRPLTYFTLTLNYYFNQLRPYGYHVVNMVLHGVVVLLIFILASLLFARVGLDGLTLPFLTALIFAVHLTNTNVVTYVIGRAASVSTIFYLSSVILFFRARQGFRWGLLLSAVSDRLRSTQ